MCYGQKTNLKRRDLEAKRKALQQEIIENKKILERTRVQENNSLTQLNVISTQITTRVRIIDNIGQETFELSLEIEGQRKAIQTLQHDLENLKKDYADNIIAAYKRRNVNDALLYVFDSKNFNQAYKRLRYLNQYGQYRQMQGLLILNTQNAIIDGISEMIGIKQKKNFLLTEKEKEKLLLEKDKKVEAVMLNKLQQKVSELNQQIVEQEKNAKRLNKAIGELIAREIEEARRAEEARMRAAAKRAAKVATAKNKPLPVVKDTRTANSYLNEADLKLSNDFASNKGRLPWPLESGNITESFGEHSHPSLKGVITNNNGVDITTKTNATVQTIFNGTVKAIFPIPGMERVVLISHGEYFTVYARLATVFVKIGQQIETGDKVGILATSEEDGTTRLHFEIYKQRVLQNPQLWIKRGH